MANIENNSPNCFPFQWGRVGGFVYPVYRLLVAVGFLLWLPVDYWYDLVYFQDGELYLWFVFATNWTFMSLLLAAVLHASITLYYTCTAKGSTINFVYILLHWTLE